MKRLHLTYIALLFAGFGLAGCDSTEPEDNAGEEELITRVVLTLEGANQTIEVEVVDEDGDGVLDEIGELELAAGETYAGSVALFNDLESPPEDITEEVEEEDYAHQFQYSVTGDADRYITVSNLDVDRNGLDLGLSFDVSVSDEASAGTEGTFVVVLRHYDEATEDNTAPKENDTGETDIRVDVPLVLQ